MKKKDVVPAVILVLLIFVWMYIDKTFIAPKFPQKAPVAVEQPQTDATATTTGDQQQSSENATIEESKAVEKIVVKMPEVDEVVQVLENEHLKLELTSFGGGIKSVTLLDIPELNEKESPPVSFSFSPLPALNYAGIDGIAFNDAFTSQLSDDGTSVVFSKELENGLVFQRTITLGEQYLLTLNDRFVNATDEEISLEEFRIVTGSMSNPTNTIAQRGVIILGVDSYSAEGGLNYWGRKLKKIYGKAKPLSIDAVPMDMAGVNVDWVSTKNKFFVQILSPENNNATISIISERDPDKKGVVPESISAALDFEPVAIAANSDYDLNYSYFVGPKKYSTLKDAGNHMEKVMEFETVGMFSWMNWLMEPSRRALLWVLNMFNGIVHNYGLAIILLTLLVRILFWPLTHKSTESMKRMQELQPEIKALQAKYEGDSQKIQQETMALYKERKVNPMGGCLPMFVQIPVFIALFTVLRNAIELRYAGFLWITDLSTPENLFAGQIPVIGSLNILPLLMSLSMIWQQKLTPQAASTPEQQQQQKMMMFMMPIMMLFFFYSMPSGLVLYWTTSNLLMIAQISLRNRKKKDPVAA